MVFIILISIHAPLTGCDDNPFTFNLHPYIFQSTHPLRDATNKSHVLFILIVNFNPRTPYGMRHTFNLNTVPLSLISIHAPLTGCDFSNQFKSCIVNLISIHAPLTGCDTKGGSGMDTKNDFNPRTPYGMRLSRQLRLTYYQLKQ